MNDNEIMPEAAVVTEKKAPKKERGSLFGDVFDVFDMFMLCTAVILLVFLFIGRLTVVEGPSMQETLYEGNYVIISDLGYEPKQGDIVVVQNASLEGAFADPLIKRVIATGGQTVSIYYDGGDFVVTVDGVKLDESEYIHLDPQYVSPTYIDSYTVPDGKIFVMGDNRNHSADSRMSYVGTVDERCIIGKALMRILPFNKITSFN